MCFVPAVVPKYIISLVDSKSNNNLNHQNHPEIQQDFWKCFLLMSLDTPLAVWLGFLLMLDTTYSMLDIPIREWFLG